MKLKTALLTGASSGIGEQLARLLAGRGHDVILSARSVGKLEALARELTLAHGVKADVVAADLTDPVAPGLLLERVTALGTPVDILVNNAGFGSCGDFLDLPLATELDMLRVNCLSLLALCHHFGQRMRQRGAGRILNIASTAGFQPGPYMATYYASKAFVISFSLALARELAGSGVSVTCHCPGATETPFIERAGLRDTRLFQHPSVAKAEDVAEHAYRAMLRGKRLAVHGALNRAAATSVRFFPVSWVSAVTAGLNRRVPGAGSS